MLKNKAGFWKTSFLIYGLTLNHLSDEQSANAGLVRQHIASHDDSPKSTSPAKR